MIFRTADQNPVIDSITTVPLVRVGSPALPPREVSGYSFLAMSSKALWLDIEVEDWAMHGMNLNLMCGLAAAAP